MKTLLRPIALTIALSAPSMTYATGFPTIDISQIATSIQELQQLRATLMNARSQLRELEAMYEGMKGLRGLANLLASEYVLDLDEEVIEELNNLIESYDIQNLTIGGAVGQRDVAIMTHTLKRITSNQQLLDMAQGRFTEIKKLVDQLDQTEDLKASTDLSARATSELNMLLNTFIQMQGSNARLKAEQEIAQKQMINDYFIYKTTIPANVEVQVNNIRNVFE